MIILSIILFLVFLVLGGFHFYWLFGGLWGLDSVIPTKEGGTSTLIIPKFATLVVAIGLVLFGLIYIVNTDLIDGQLPSWIGTYVLWLIPSVFMLRAIGEFKYVGYFKKIKNTKFAKADSKIFVPLCFGIGILGMLIQLLK